jgi:hypothetical protein
MEARRVVIVKGVFEGQSLSSYYHPKLADQERQSGCCLSWFAKARVAVSDLPQFLDDIPFDEDP